MDSSVAFSMTRAEIIELLKLLGARLAENGTYGELFIVGGAAMALAYDSTRTTADIDAIIKPRTVIIDQAKIIAAEQNLPNDWLNDSVRRLMPMTLDDKPREVAQFPGLSISIGSPEYILAMKALVTRKSQSDLEDAARICLLLGIFDEWEIEKSIRKYLSAEPLGAQELWLEDIALRTRELANQQAATQ